MQAAIQQDEFDPRRGEEATHSGPAAKARPADELTCSQLGKLIATFEKRNAAGANERMLEHLAAIGIVDFKPGTTTEAFSRSLREDIESLTQLKEIRQQIYVERALESDALKVRSAVVPREITRADRVEQKLDLELQTLERRGLFGRLYHRVFKGQDTRKEIEKVRGRLEKNEKWRSSRKSLLPEVAHELREKQESAERARTDFQSTSAILESREQELGRFDCYFDSEHGVIALTDYARKLSAFLPNRTNEAELFTAVQSRLEIADSFLHNEWRSAQDLHRTLNTGLFEALAVNFLRLSAIQASDWSDRVTGIAKSEKLDSIALFLATVWHAEKQGAPLTTITENVKYLRRVEEYSRSFAYEVAGYFPNSKLTENGEVRALEDFAREIDDRLNEDLGRKGLSIAARLKTGPVEAGARLSSVVAVLDRLRELQTAGQFGDESLLEEALILSLSTNSRENLIRRFGLAYPLTERFEYGDEFRTRISAIAAALPCEPAETLYCFAEAERIIKEEDQDAARPIAITLLALTAIKAALKAQVEAEAIRLAEDAAVIPKDSSANPADHIRLTEILSQINELYTGKHSLIAESLIDRVIIETVRTMEREGL